jgi:glycosyltransferase involved in cell wall biosynthesis
MSSALRIVWTVSNWKRTGPVEPSLDLARAVAARGHDVRVLVGRAPAASTDPNTAAAAAAARGLVAAPGDVRLAKHGAPWRDALDVRRVRASLAAWPPDVIVTTLAGDHRLLQRAARGRIPVARLLFEDPEAVVGVRARRALCRAAALFPFDEDAVARLARLGVPADRVQCIDPPLDIASLLALAGSREAARARWGVAPGRPLFGIVARMQRHRRFDLLWDALAVLRDQGLDFAFAAPGRGTWEEEVVHEPLRRLGLEQTVLRPGYLRGADYASLLRALDAQVFLVPGSDPTCRALREGMALGVPSVALRRGLLPAIVEEGVTGYLVQETPEALAAALARLAHDAPLRQRMAVAAAARAAARYDAEAVAARIETVLGGLR